MSSERWRWILLFISVLLAACGTEQMSAVSPSDQRTPSDVQRSALAEQDVCPSRSSDGRVHVVHPAEVVDFETLEEMVRGSELTITGTVDSIEKGPRIGAESEPPSDYMAKLVDVRVDDVLSASRKSDVEPGDIVTITELGWRADDGAPIVLDGYPEVCVGDQALWSLSAARVSKGMYVHGIAEVYPFENAEVADTGRVVGPVEDIERLSVGTLIARARHAGEGDGP